MTPPAGAGRPPGAAPGNAGPGAARAPLAPRAVLLDWDNTLIENWGAIHGAMIATLEAMGKPPWPLEETRRRAQRSLRNGFPEIFGARWEEARDIFYARFAATHLASLEALPGAAALLAELHERGVFLAVVSNKSGGYLRGEATHLGWAGLFGAIVGAGDAAEDKPAAAPVTLALAGSGIAPGARVWFVGDGAVDMECARRAGCLAVLLRERPPAAGEFGPQGPDVHARGCAELAALLRTLQVPADTG